MDRDQLCGDVTSGIVSSEWYAPSSYAFSDHYMTPFPSSTVEGSQWMPTSYARSSVPDLGMAAFTVPQPPLPHLSAPGRPRSSPSTFGPSPDSIPWSSSNPLGIQYGAGGAQPTPVTSTFPPSVFQNYASTPEDYSTSSPPEIRHPQPRRSYPNIAPNPAGMAAQKRRRDDDEEAGSSRGKRKRTSSVASADLSEDDRYLVQLKEDEGLPWKDIATRFGTDRGKNFQVAALQMRYKRLREKFRVWEDQDVNALKASHDYWEKYKWEIISAKMLEFGIDERWPARHCARKMQELETIAAVQSTAAGFTPAISQYASPIEGPVHFAFMPIQ